MNAAATPTSITPATSAEPRRGPHRARRPRLDRSRARARPPARPRRVRRRERAADHRQRARRPRHRIRPARRSRRRVARPAPARGRSCPAPRQCSSESALLALAPGERFLDLASWVWPVLLATLVVSSFRGARRSLANWSRRALLYPGARGAVPDRRRRRRRHRHGRNLVEPGPGERPHLPRNGHRLYLNCVGSGSPTVVLFNGLGEWTPNWAWVQANVSATTRVCAFDRAGEGWSGGKAVREDGHQLASDLHAPSSRRACPRAVRPCRALGRRHLRARLRRRSIRGRSPESR